MRFWAAPQARGPAAQHCYLDNAVPMALGDPNLPNCSSMSGGICAPITRRAPERLSSTIPEPRRGSETLGIRGAIEQAVRQSTEMGEQYEAEQRRIIEIGARFALFVEKNAILGFNASPGTYLRTQIESLQNRIPSDLSEPHEHILQSLEHFRRSLDGCNEERRTFQQALRDICHHANCAGGPRDVQQTRQQRGPRPRQGPTPWLRGK